MINMFKFFLVIFFSLNCNALTVGTYHTDGSITDKEGKVLRKSYADRYQQALARLKTLGEGENTRDQYRDEVYRVARS